MTAVGCLPRGTSALRLQTFLYLSAAILGFFVVIPVGITLRNFHGACILYAEVVRWRKWTIWPWNEPSCLFVLYANLALNVCYASFMTLVSCLLHRRTPRHALSLQSLFDWNTAFILRAFNPIFLVINFCAMFFEVAGASIVTSGLADFCNRTETFVNRLPDKQLLGLQNDHTYKCMDLGKEASFWSSLNVARGTSQGVRGHSFYGCLVVAAIASWILFGIWLAQFVLNVLMTCRVCSCEVAEEKRKGQRTAIIAQRRSRLATPIATPGGMMTPSRSLASPPAQYYPPQAPPSDQDMAPPASPAPSSTPPKEDPSFQESSPRTVLQPPKQKKLYSKKTPQPI